MNVRGPILTLLIVASAAGASRHKPEIDPESQDGILLQRIQQEPLPARKLAFLEKYVEQYKQTLSIAWVYEQLLPIYHESQEFDKELTTAESLLALDPQELDAAHHALRASEARNDPALVEKYAQLAWDLASKAAQCSKPEDADEAASWTKQVAFARDVMNYSEYALYSQAKESGDPQKKMELIQVIEQRNPRSKYLDSAKKDYFRAFQEKESPEETIALAEKALLEEPDNEDMLLTVAQYYFDRERESPKVLSYAQRILNVLERKVQPDSASPEDWTAKKSRYVGVANWMAGVIYAQDGRYGLSDQHLRSALSYIDEPKLLAPAYYYLGYDNYAIATEQHDRGRAQEALKYSKLCAGMSGPFQSAAQRNLQVLKSDFNLQ